MIPLENFVPGAKVSMQAKEERLAHLNNPCITIADEAHGKLLFNMQKDFNFTPGVEPAEEEQTPGGHAPGSSTIDDEEQEAKEIALPGANPAFIS